MKIVTMVAKAVATNRRRQKKKTFNVAWCKEYTCGLWSLAVSSG